MSMNAYHYLGWYFKCILPKEFDLFSVFPDESFHFVNHVKNSVIFLPNQYVEGSFTLDKYHEAGDFPVVFPEIKEIFSNALMHLKSVLGEDNVDLRYGVVTYII